MFKQLKILYVKKKLIQIQIRQKINLLHAQYIKCIHIFT